MKSKWPAKITRAEKRGKFLFGDKEDAMIWTSCALSEHPDFHLNIVTITMRGEIYSRGFDYKTLTKRAHDLGNAFEYAVRTDDTAKASKIYTKIKSLNKVMKT